MMRAQAVEQRPKLAEVSKVADADGAAADLVLVRGPDAAAGRADLPRARRILAQPVEIAVDGQDERTGLGDAQHLGCDFDALLAMKSDAIEVQWPDGDLEGSKEVFPGGAVNRHLTLKRGSGRRPPVTR